MRKPSVLLGIISVACALSAALSWWQLRAAREAVSMLERRLAAPHRESHADAHSAPASASPPVAAATTRQAASNPLEQQPEPRMQDGAAMQRRLFANPNYRKAFSDQQRLAIEFAFRELPRVLNLTPEQSRKVFDLFVEQSVETMISDLDGPADEEAAQAMMRKRSAREKEYDARVAEIIGARRMDDLREFRATLQGRNRVNELNSKLPIESALREDQVEPLIAVFHEEEQLLANARRELEDSSRGSMSDAGAYDKYQARQQEIAVKSAQRVHHAAAPLLSSQQLAALDDLFIRERRWQEVSVAMQRAIVEASVSTPAIAKGN
jgi:hypothetical protein